MFGFLSSPPPFKKVFCFPLLHGACSALREQAKRAGFCSRCASRSLGGTPADPFQRGLVEGLGVAGAGAAQASGGRQHSGGLCSGPRDGMGRGEGVSVPSEQSHGGAVLLGLSACSALPPTESPQCAFPVSSKALVCCGRSVRVVFTERHTTTSPIRYLKIMSPFGGVAFLIIFINIFCFLLEELLFCIFLTFSVLSEIIFKAYYCGVN